MAMTRTLLLGYLGVLLFGAAATAGVAVFTAPSRGAAGQGARGREAQPRLPGAAAPLALPQLPQLPQRPAQPAPALPVLAPEEYRSLQAVDSVEDAPGAVTFESPEERADTLTEMQRKRLESGMDALNRRAARQAAGASGPPGR
jgi:hypothetical protein